MVGIWEFVRAVGYLEVWETSELLIGAGRLGLCRIWGVLLNPPEKFEYLWRLHGNNNYHHFLHKAGQKTHVLWWIQYLRWQARTGDLRHNGESSSCRLVHGLGCRGKFRMHILPARLCILSTRMQH